MNQLIFTPLSIEHLDIIHPAITGNVAEYFYPFKSKEETLNWINNAIQKQQKGTKKEFIVFDRDTFVGMISPSYLTHDTVEIGLWVSPNQQGKGYGHAMLQNFLTQLKLEGVGTVIYETEKQNIASIKLAMSLDFIPEDNGIEIRFIKNI